MIDMMKNITKSPLIILDFGSQYTQLIGRRIREIGVYCEILPYDVDKKTLQSKNPCGFILSGGPSTTTLETNPKPNNWVFESNLPILGICYGMQYMATHLGGVVAQSKKREFGYAELRLHGHTVLLKNIEDKTDENGQALLDVWMSHGDKVEQLPPGFEVICETQNAPLAGMANEEKKWFGLQFHPEVTHTLQGVRILERFVLDICDAAANWTPEKIIDTSIADIQKKVGSHKVLLALSGGVDSSVVAALLHKAIGDQLICVFVDTGLLRLNEADQVMKMFQDHMGINIVHVKAENCFLSRLKEVTCPEQKRKIIGKTFIEVFDEQAHIIKDVTFLAQGTIYPDVIESAATNTKGGSEVIKSHHNVGGLPEKMNLKLLEPIRELFKDEVRKVGLELGLAYDMVYRHPFPGPGLGVRILGEVKKEFADMLRLADAIFIEALKKSGWYQKVSQAFAVFIPVKSVGVMGDSRRYEYVISLRAVETVDFMTAKWSRLPYELLDDVSSQIINEVSGISRVTYDISGKPPATIEWE